MTDILDSIAAYKRLDVAERMAGCKIGELEARAKMVSEPRGFRDALVRGHRPGALSLIAEIKKASPSKGLIRADFDPPSLARAYQDGGAACLSVLTDAPSFQGADSYLTAARDACTLPTLRKEFLVDPWQVAESRTLGADAILVILAMVDDSLAADLMSEARRFGMDALVEVHDQNEMERACRLGSTLVGVNNRNLRTFEIDLTITEGLAAQAPENALLVTESGIFGPDDAVRLEQCGARAMLVGESLMRQADVAAATRNLLGDHAQST
jgi:indole-3-glycerol phosphate synthase